jgi:hypothetical protein
MLKKLILIACLLFCAPAFGQQDGTFQVWGPLVLVGTSPAQVVTTNGVLPTSYRVKCLVTGYFSWAPANPSGTTPTIPTPTAPSAGVPSPNTIGMTLGQTETFQLPPNAWFQSNNAAGFEIAPGQGM